MGRVRVKVPHYIFALLVMILDLSIAIFIAGMPKTLFWRIFKICFRQCFKQQMTSNRKTIVTKTGCTKMQRALCCKQVSRAPALEYTRDQLYKTREMRTCIAETFISVERVID
jgi:hypothetical protein